MEQQTMTLESVSKRCYDLGRKLYNLKVARELTSNKEEKKK